MEFMKVCKAQMGGNTDNHTIFLREGKLVSEKERTTKKKKDSRIKEPINGVPALIHVSASEVELAIKNYKMFYDCELCNTPSQVIKTYADIHGGMLAAIFNN